MIKALTQIILIATLLVLLPSSAFAQLGPNPFGNNANTINLGNQLTGKNLGVPAPATGGIVGTVLKNALSLLYAVGGIGTLVYFVWGAVDWIMSGGDKEKVSSARKKMTNAIVGLVLLALSFFVISLVGEIVGFNPLKQLDIRSLGDK